MSAVLKVQGPDADGLYWLHIGKYAMFNLGKFEGIAGKQARAALREGAVQTAEASPEPVARYVSPFHRAWALAHDGPNYDKAAWRYVQHWLESELPKHEPSVNAAVPSASGQGPAGLPPTGASE